MENIVTKPENIQNMHQLVDLTYQLQYSRLSISKNDFLLWLQDKPALLEDFKNISSTLTKAQIEAMTEYVLKKEAHEEAVRIKTSAAARVLFTGQQGSGTDLEITKPRNAPSSILEPFFF